MPRTVAIIQARLGSTRLPGKVLKLLAGRPMLAQVIDRVRRCPQLDEVLVATTTQPADDALADFCAAHPVACFRGDENDVLDRYYRAAQSVAAEVIVRITSDCPFVDPDLIGQIVQHLATTGADYASNVATQRTYPRGLDAEAFTFAILERCWREATDASSREHVTAFIYRNPDRFRIENVAGDTDESAHRWTVDTPEDYALAERVYAHFGHNRFGWREVLTLLAEHPDWRALNAHIEQKAH